MNASLGRDVNHPSAVGAAALTAGAAVLAFNMMPFVVGSIADTYGYGAEQLGYIATAYMSGYTLMTVALVFCVRRIDWRQICLWVGILQLSGFALTPNAESFQALAGLFFMTGLCGGLLFGTAMTSLADTRNPDRGFGLGSLSQVALGAAVAFALPRSVIPAYGFQGMMLVLAAGAGLIVLLSPMMVARGVATQDTGNAQGGDKAGPLAGLLGVFSLYTGLTAMWVFFERIGRDAGLSGESIGTIIMVALLCGGIATFVPVVIGDRFGRRLPISLAGVAAIMIIALFGRGVTPTSFTLLVPCFSFCWTIAIVYAPAAVAAADSSGRYRIWIPAALGLGGAVGPALGGILQRSGNIQATCIMAASMVALSTVLLFWVTGRNLETAGR